MSIKFKVKGSPHFWMFGPRPTKNVGQIENNLNSTSIKQALGV